MLQLNPESDHSMLCDQNSFWVSIIFKPIKLNATPLLSSLSEVADTELVRMTGWNGKRHFDVSRSRTHEPQSSGENLDFCDLTQKVL